MTVGASAKNLMVPARIHALLRINHSAFLIYSARCTALTDVNCIFQKWHLRCFPYLSLHMHS